jgi:acetoacetate decarboxylase
MPAHFGSPKWHESAQAENGDLFYEDVTRISISYLTDAGHLTRFLPHPYELSGAPIVTVGYSRSRGISWLAGGDYNVITVSASATYPGKVDKVSGGYPLVLWENLTEPILTGREKQGLPKIYGEIEDHRVYDGAWSTSLSNNGQTMLEMRATDLTEVGLDALKKMNEDGQRVNVMGWKYIPDETASSAILSYATVYPMSFQYREAWSANGELQWHPRKWEELPTQAHIVNALHALPVKEIVSCNVSKGSSLLHSGMVRRMS